MMALVTIQPETPIYVTGAGAGGGPAVNVYSGLDNSLITSFFAFEEDFTGGVQTAVADINNDGISDVIVGAGAGGGPRVIVYDGSTNFSTQLFDFFAFSTEFSGGVDVAAGDFNADGFADIVVGAGPGGGPQVSIFDGQTGNVLTQFFAYDQSFRGGVTVAVGDVDGSSFNSVITGAGAGIAKASAKLFAREGARVAIIELNAETGSAAADEIRAEGGEALFVETDVTRDDSVRNAVEAIAATERDASRVLIVAHGAVGTLLYCHLAGHTIDRRWDQPPNTGGNYFGFSLQPRGVSSWWQAIDAEGVGG
jgi:hypothetical protein